jgi:hypothetical protein
MQPEYATDIVFHSAATLNPLYEQAMCRYKSGTTMPTCSACMYSSYPAMDVNKSW